MCLFDVTLPDPFFEQVILRPSFSQHYDTVVLDWRVVERATLDALAEQGRWAFRQNITVLVDFTRCDSA